MAWESGINCMDTAKGYGNSEDSIGKYLYNRKGKSWDVFTKISSIKENVSVQIEDSINKLTIEPKIVLAHSMQLFLDKNFQKDLSKAREKKLINKTGVSLYSEIEIKKVLLSAYKPDVIQLPLNILDTILFRKGILANLRKRDIV